MSFVEWPDQPHKTTKQLAAAAAAVAVDPDDADEGVLSFKTTCFWLLAANRFATIFSVLVKADSMRALSLSRRSSVVSRVVAGCSMKRCGLCSSEELVVTAHGGTGVEGSSGMAVRVVGQWLAEVT